MTQEPTVYVIQDQQRWDESAQKLVPKHNFESAMTFGRLEFLLSPKAAPFNPETVLGEMHAKLANFSDRDHLVLVGNPALIGWAVSLAALYNNGKVSVLQWSGKDQKYIRIACQGLSTKRDTAAGFTSHGRAG